MGVVLFEHGSSAVSGGDLLHDMQAEDVGSILRGFRLFERGQHGGLVADAVVGEGQAELTAADLGATAGTNFCWCCPAFRETFCKPNWNRSALPRRWHPYPAIRISAFL